MTTMKTAIIFALIGVSFCFDEANNLNCHAVFKGDHNSKKDCLNHVLQHAPRLVRALEAVFCKHRDPELYKMKEQIYEEAKEEINQVTACTGCVLGTILGIPVTIDHIGKELGILVGETGETVIRITEVLGIAKPLASFLCIALRGTLGKECQTYFAKNDVENKSAKIVYCEAQKKTPNPLVILGGLNKVGCIDQETYQSIKNNEPGSDLACNLVDFNLESLLGSLLEILATVLHAVACLLNGLLGG